MQHRPHQKRRGRQRKQLTQLRFRSTTVSRPLLLSLQLLLQFCLFRYQLSVYCLRARQRCHHLHLDQFIRLARTLRAFNDLIHLLNGFNSLFPCHRSLPIKLLKMIRSARVFTAAAHAMAA